MSLDPFNDDPFLILGLPEYVLEHEITRKWKQLVFSTHPDKNNGSTKNVQITQIYNNAKERAIKQLPSKKWLRELYHTIQRDLEKDLKGAEEARIMYEARYLKQEKEKEEKAARQQEEKEKKSAWKLNKKRF
jgi:curved DNA-binding protein CbpA